MMYPWVAFGLLGGLGGLIRGIVGVRKATMQGRKFVFSYFLGTIILAVVIGTIVGSIFGTNQVIAFAAGYAGTDLLEGIAKSLKIMPVKIGK